MYIPNLRAAPPKEKACLLKVDGSEYCTSERLSNQYGLWGAWKRLALEKENCCLDGESFRGWLCTCSTIPRFNVYLCAVDITCNSP